MITIVDYGLGNLTSVAGALARFGAEYCITGDPSTLTRATKLILPGVGAFGDGMRNLESRGLIDPLRRMVLDRGTPVLAICLGFQLLSDTSSEFGQHRGLGWIGGSVTRLEPRPPTLRVPHVGWNEVLQTRESEVFREIPDGALFYYVHSYRFQPKNPEVTIGECDYGGRFCAAVQWRNIVGTQFHPEKSQQHGITVLRNFIERF